MTIRTSTRIVIFISLLSYNNNLLTQPFKQVAHCVYDF